MSVTPENLFASLAGLRPGGLHGRDELCAAALCWLLPSLPGLLPALVQALPLSTPWAGDGPVVTTRQGRSVLCQAGSGPALILTAGQVLSAGRPDPAGFLTWSRLERLLVAASAGAPAGPRHVAHEFARYLVASDLALGPLRDLRADDPAAMQRLLGLVQAICPWLEGPEAALDLSGWLLRGRAAERVDLWAGFLVPPLPDYGFLPARPSGRNRPEAVVYLASMARHASVARSLVPPEGYVLRGDGPGGRSLSGWQAGRAFAWPRARSAGLGTVLFEWFVDDPLVRLCSW